jgi:hypothetical protein
MPRATNPNSSGNPTLGHQEHAASARGRAMRIGVTMASVAVFATALVYSVTSLHVSRVYCIMARFDRLPETDEGLAQWLKTQPGVVAHTVHLTREGSKVRVWFIMSQNLRWSPPMPNLSRQCHLMGYDPVPVWEQDDSNTM